MPEKKINLSLKSLSELLILTGLCLLGLTLSGLLSIGLIVAFSGLSLPEVQNLAAAPELVPNSRVYLLIMQAIVAGGSFIAFPALIFVYDRSSAFRPATRIVPNFTILGMVVGLAVLMMPVNAWLAAWNNSIHLPSFLSEFQQWARAKEQMVEELTLYLVNFQSGTEIGLGFLVVSLLAGLSEEFFFRRLLQPRFIALVGSPHLGIWVTAFIFSAIHMQFYGLIPRMVLGALFGYYYYWTGNIWLPVLGHALNNGITLVGMILYQSRISPINVEDPTVIPWYIGAVAAGVTWSVATMLKEEADKQKLVLKLNREPDLQTLP